MKERAAATAQLEHLPRNRCNSLKEESAFCNYKQSALKYQMKVRSKTIIGEITALLIGTILAWVWLIVL